MPRLEMHIFDSGVSVRKKRRRQPFLDEVKEDQSKSNDLSFGNCLNPSIPGSVLESPNDTGHGVRLT
jgi:hypothetical protein